MEISQYLSVFMDECQEHLLTLNQSLLELEHNPDSSGILDKIFRAAHTLKGASATMGFNKMADLTHAMEDVLSKLRAKEMSLTADMMNTLFEAVDLLEILTNKIGEGKEEDIEISGVVQELRHFVTADTAVVKVERRQKLQLRYLEAEKEQIAAAMDQGAKLYHVDVTLADDCLLKGARVFMVLREIEKKGTVIRSIPTVKELEDENFELRFIIGCVSAATAGEIHKAVYNISDVANVEVEEVPLDEIQLEKRVQDAADHDKTKISSNPTVRVEIRKLDDLMNLVAELVINRSRLESLGSTLRSKELNEVVEQVGRLTLDLRDSVLKARMVPVETVFSRFPRLVRDLSKELGKQIELEIFGGETELDRTVIDEIGDPLVHIIRNAIDHGIEGIEQRRATGKPEQGKITLNAYQEGNNVIITVTDDGRGFDPKRVREKALRLGLVSPEILSEMPDEQILDFTFLPGFSTADKVTDVSGRGVGMDVVKTKVDSLGGLVHIESELGEGSRIVIRLPLTLAIIQTLMVQLGKEIYAIPSSYIDQITSLNRTDIKRVRKQEVFMLRGEVIPLIRLQDVLEIPDAKNSYFDELDVVVLKVGERLIGCVVDGLLRQQDVVIKSLGGFLGAIKGIAGATILGDGRVALILDIRAVA
ncbi:two-component system chemotaxis sensor kinase CheA [Hydrogenispora ethanolica]|uniref:Chemotaxis protein CheA n=1 Tax=Hydrogenispora ethanolica TaxID=1082276 RepID=A0A4R1RK58_HYDET|nr:chemotaxis protein CheA [Hydrogenispora ethanolica]TCL66565.1 two-component system chemotaxis sensor kinase CheA [Hydrogenispora ethanolica]